MPSADSWTGSRVPLTLLRRRALDRFRALRGDVPYKLPMRFPPMTPVVRFGMALFFGAYILQLILANWLGFPTLPLQLSLDLTNGPTPATGYQIVTYLLAADTSPSGVWAILIGLLFFWLLVAPFEQAYGKKKTIQLMVFTGLATSLAIVPLGFVFRGALYGFSYLSLASFSAFVWAMRHRGQMSFFGMWSMSPMQMLGLVVGLSVIQFLASRDVLSLVAGLVATGAGVAFMELQNRPQRPKRSSGKFRVIEGGAAKSEEKVLH